MNIEILVDDLLKRMHEEGIDTKVTYCISDYKIVSFVVEIIGFLD